MHVDVCLAVHVLLLLPSCLVSSALSPTPPSLKQAFNISSNSLKPLLNIFSFNNLEPTLTAIFPFFSVLTPSPPRPFLSPSTLLSNQIRLSPSVDQSRHIQTRGRGEEGDRCRRDHLRDLSVSDQTPTRTPPSTG